MEFIGRARTLRDRIAAAHAAYDEAAEALIAPFRPRDGFTPMPRHAHLSRLARRWRVLPRYGRLRGIVKNEPGKLQLAETRAAPDRVSLPGWDDDELAVSILLRLIVIRPPVFLETQTLVAVIGLHALARRYERGVARTDATVLRDLALVGAAWRATAPAGGEFAVPASGGYWRGAVMAPADGAPTLAVRTYVA